jgi:Protein of unknown function (DUF3579)
LCTATTAILVGLIAPLYAPSRANSQPMLLPTSQQVFIQGITRDGKTFRPSDWAERLCGVMSQFRPGGAVPGSHLSYSEWCLPTNLGDIKCVVVHHDLRDTEVMAWDFVMNFAKDNNLQVTEGCLLPQSAK